MRRVVLLFGAVLFLSVAASAQEHIVTVASPSPAASPAPPAINHYADTVWQIAFGYQYNRINLTGKPFNTEGFNVSFVRFVNDWFGVEAVMGAGFGNTHSATNPPNLDAKTLFVAGGFHIAHRHGRVEPFLHGLEGMERFRFSQASSRFGANPVFGFEGGGGIDFHLNPRTAIRGEADYLGTRFQGTFQRNFQVTGGLVLNF